MHVTHSVGARIKFTLCTVRIRSRQKASASELLQQYKMAIALEQSEEPNVRCLDALRRDFINYVLRCAEEIIALSSASPRGALGELFYL